MAIKKKELFYHLLFCSLGFLNFIRNYQKKKIKKMNVQNTLPECVHWPTLFRYPRSLLLSRIYSWSRIGSVVSYGRHSEVLNQSRSSDLILTIQRDSKKIRRDQQSKRQQWAPFNWFISTDLRLQVTVLNVWTALKRPERLQLGESLQFSKFCSA